MFLSSSDLMKTKYVEKYSSGHPQTRPAHLIKAKKYGNDKQISICFICTVGQVTIKCNQLHFTG